MPAWVRPTLPIGSLESDGFPSLASHQTSIRRVGIPLLLFLGGLTADFTPLSVYLSLHVSDVLLIGAGLLALPRIGEVPRRVVGFLATNRDFLVVAILGALFLVGTGISTVIAGAPLSGMETWLLFAMLFGLLVPATAVAVARHEHGMLALALGLVSGAVAAAVGYLVKAVALGEAFFHGVRPLGIFGSDPFFLMIVGLAVVVAHMTVSLFPCPSPSRSPRGSLAWGLLLAEAISVCVVIAALLVSRYRASWVASAVLLLVVVSLVTRSTKALALTAGVGALAFAAVYTLGGLPDALVQRIEQSLSSSQPDIAARVEATGQLLAAWSERPWGLGLGESSSYLSPELVAGLNPSVHNVVGHFLVEGGPLAALAMAALPLALTVVWWRHSWRAANDWRQVWPIAALWAVFVAAYFSPTLYNHAAWASVGALLGSAARVPGQGSPPA